MPVYQINIWICDVCRRMETTTEDIYPSDEDIPLHPPGFTSWEDVRAGAIIWDELETLSKKAICPECRKARMPDGK